MKQELGIAGKLAHTFLNSKLTPLFIAASLAIGAFSIAIIPRESGLRHPEDEQGPRSSHSSRRIHADPL